MKLKVVLDEGAIMPTRAHDSDAGLDIYSPRNFSFGGVWDTCKCVTIDTGVHIEIPHGYVGFLKSKSGLNVREGITGEGVIDSGYTGSIVVKLYKHHGIDPLHFDRGDKLIQLVILPCALPELELVDSLEETERGENGFGSTGK